MVDADLGGSAAFLRRGLLHNQLGDFAGMTDDLEAAQRADPTDPYPWMHQGHVAGAMGRPLFAVACLRAALDRATPACQAEMRINLAENLLRLDWLDEAARLARAVPADVRDWWAATRSRALARYAGRRAEARALLRMRRTAPLPAAAQLDLAGQLLSLGRLACARRLCAALIRERERPFAAFALMARVIARAEGGEAALAFVRSVYLLHPGDSDWMHDATSALAHLLHDLGRFEEAIATVEHYGWRGFGALQSLVGIAHIALGQVQSLLDASRTWMLSAPESVPAGCFLITAFHRVREKTRGPLRPAAPRRAHLVQFWHDAGVPDDVRETMSSWRRHHPGLDVSLFDSQGAAGFIRDAFGADTREAFARCHHPAMQADLFRIAFLAHAGGLYADADELCLAPLPAVMARAGSAEMAAVRSGETPSFLHNYFMGARAGSPILHRALRIATASILEATREGRPIDIWQTTGPGLITRTAGLVIAERFDSICGDDLVLLSLQQYRAFTRAAEDLAYKRQSTANWRLS